MPVKVAVFGAKSYDETVFTQVNQRFGHELTFLEPHLTQATASLATGYSAVCAFVNDQLDSACLSALNNVGVSVIALRCAGFNNVDLAAASQLGMKVVRVPEYSPHGVAEHAVALILGLNRKIYRVYNRVRENNFSLEGLLGFNLHGKAVGVIGTGRIGSAFCQIMLGFGCRVLAFDPTPDAELVARGVEYTDMQNLLTQSDIISLHCPLTADTQHLINRSAMMAMKPGVMLINTSRGALVDTAAVIQQLKTGHIGYLGLDVYEEEADLFFEDESGQILEDDQFARLLTFPNVLISGHQAFFTAEALDNIASTTLQNLTELDERRQCENEVRFN